MKANLNDIITILESGMDDMIKQAFGKSLKALREHTGTTQREIAEVAKVPNQSISVYERGANNPTITQAYRIALYFNLSIDDFINYGLLEYLGGIAEEGDYKSITDLYDAVNKEG